MSHRKMSVVNVLRTVVLFLVVNNNNNKESDHFQEKMDWTEMLQNSSL